MLRVFFFAAVLPKLKCWHRTGTELLDFSATFLQHKNMAPKSSQVCGIFVFKVLSTWEANVTILESNVTMSEKPPVACFAAGHRKIFKQELAALDVAHRKLLRRVVGPPAGMDWSRPWHEILHDWNVRVSIFVGQAGLKPWSHTCLEQHWKLAQYAVNLPCDRWLPRLLHWKPVGQRRVGRPHQQWDDMLRTFCRYQRWGNGSWPHEMVEIGRH